MFNKSTRSYYFRSLVEDARRKHRSYKWEPHELTWREARLMFKGATAAAMVKEEERQARIASMVKRLGLTKREMKFLQETFH